MTSTWQMLSWAPLAGFVVFELLIGRAQRKRICELREVEARLSATIKATQDRWLVLLRAASEIIVTIPAQSDRGGPDAQS